MKRKRPAFLFYVRDWLTDNKVRAMSMEARGLYMDALCHCWLDGLVPAEAEPLGKLLKVNPRTLARLWPQVAPCFSPVENSDRLQQVRLEFERNSQRIHREFAANAARRRWGA